MSSIIGTGMNMNISYAKGLVKNYADNQWAIINQVFIQDDLRDSRSVWLSLDTIKAFIAQIEQPNEGAGPATGIRLYFGAYSAEQPHPTKDYDRLHTLLMIPTVLTEDGKNTDYDATTGTFDFSALSTVSALNHGHLVPPPFSTTGPDNMYEQGNTFMAYADNQ